MARQFVAATMRLSVYTALSARMRSGESPKQMLRTLQNLQDHEAKDPAQDASERRLVREFAESLLDRFSAKDDQVTGIGPLLAVAMQVFEPKSLSFMEKVVLDLSREEFEQRSSTYMDEPPQRAMWRKVAEVLRDTAEVLAIRAGRGRQVS
ncbi:hypothetical protein ACVIGB_000977 [Bradyrhizobium sp. USDA 4341]